MASPKQSRPSSRVGQRAVPMSSSRKITYIVTLGIVAILVVVYLLTGEASTKDSDFYKRTVALMEQKGRDPGSSQEEKAYPDKPLHRAGGLHYAEVEGHGSLEERRRGKKVQGPQALPEGMMGNPHDEQEHGEEDGRQKPMMEDQDLKERLRIAEEEAKKSADKRYRGLKDIEAEVERDRVTRHEDQKPVVHESPTSRDAQGSPTPSEKSVAGRKKMPADESPGAKVKPSPKYPMETKASSGEEEDEPESPETLKLRSLLAEMLARSPVTIFSKSTCPFSRKAKKILLEAHTITPRPFVVELNQVPMGNELQMLLFKTTGRRTVPNVLINGKSIGGGDETELLWKNGEMPARIKQMAGKRISNVVVNYAYGEEPSAPQMPRRPAGRR